MHKIEAALPEGIIEAHKLGRSQQETVKFDDFLFSLARCPRSTFLDLLFPKKKIFQEELHSARVDLASRDFCAHLLVPLNECRRKSLYMPWACGAQRHAYEKCEYFEYKRRVAKKEKENEEKKK